MDKPFKTIDEQIDILKSRNLTIINEDAAKQDLIQYGYYEIINSYKDNYLVDKDNDDAGYLPSASFENIFSLFRTDRKISEAVLSSLADFETTLKQSIAYVISENIGYLQNDYMSLEIYSIGEIHHRGRKVLTDRDILLNTLERVINSDSMPFLHYRDKVGNVPPWIAAKDLSLGSSIYWFRLLPTNLKSKIISMMYGIPEDILIASDERLNISQSFGDTLSLALEYRNLCAHGGRVYNHRNKFKQLSYSKFLYDYPSVMTMYSHAAYQRGEVNSSVGALLLALSRLKNTDSFTELNAWLKVRIDDHIKKFPNDEQYLLQSLEVKGSFLEQSLHNSQN